MNMRWDCQAWADYFQTCDSCIFSSGFFFLLFFIIIAKSKLCVGWFHSFEWLMRDGMLSIQKTFWFRMYVVMQTFLVVDSWKFQYCWFAWMVLLYFILCLTSTRLLLNIYLNFGRTFSMVHFLFLLSPSNTVIVHMTTFLCDAPRDDANWNFVPSIKSILIYNECADYYYYIVYCMSFTSD